MSYEKPAYYDKVKFKSIILNDDEYHAGSIEEIIEKAEVCE